MHRIRRIRRLASVALAEYGIGNAGLCLLRQAANTLFRVWSDDLPSAGARADLLEEGQYLLRVDQPGYQETEAIELQLAWLTTMWRKADLPVSEPVAALDGQGCSRSVMRLCPGQAIALSPVVGQRSLSGELFRVARFPGTRYIDGTTAQLLCAAAGSGRHKPSSDCLHLDPTALSA